MSAGPDPGKSKQAGPDLRELYRRQMLGSIGGWSGTVIAAIPTVVFIAVNAVTSLRPALFAAVGSALVLMVYRLARKQSTQQAISGLFGVVVAAVIAGRTGEARGYFLLGIIMSFVYAVPFGVSVLVRRPLIGLLWEFLDPTPGTRGAAQRVQEEDDEEDAADREVTEDRPWYRFPVLLRAYTLATLTGFVLFVLRGGVQAVLYHRDATGWLAVARIVMGFPLYIAAVGIGYWLVRQARRVFASS
ncbi:MAG TPA: DUF3159 domain-containing protein [Jatrophihabitans sp.]|jgi:hypothetical protein